MCTEQSKGTPLFKSFLEDIETKYEYIYIECTMVESEQSDKKSLDIAEWNPLISKHEKDILWFYYKNRI